MENLSYLVSLLVKGVSISFLFVVFTVERAEFFNAYSLLIGKNNTIFKDLPTTTVLVTRLAVA